MSSAERSKAQSIAVDEAMNRVLAAERDARLVVAECRAEAARIVSEAEMRARALAGRSEARIKAAHRIADAAIARALAELAEVPPGSWLEQEAHAAKAAREPDPGHGPGELRAVPEALERALDALVDEILGGAA